MAREEEVCAVVVEHRRPLGADGRVEAHIAGVSREVVLAELGANGPLGVLALPARRVVAGGADVVLRLPRRIVRVDVLGHVHGEQAVGVLRVRLVLRGAEPVVDAVDLEDVAAVGLDLIAIRVEPPRAVLQDRAGRAREQQRQQQHTPQRRSDHLSQRPRVT